MGEDGGFNLYAFASNAPINYFDVLGLWWTKRGVLNILCKNAAGRELVNEVISKYNIYSIEARTFKRQYFSDPGETIPIGKPLLYGVPGYHNREAREIGINKYRSDSEAASDLFHEAIHGSQYNRYEEVLLYDPNATPLTTPEKEYEAHLKQEIFNIASGIPPKDPSFRIQDGNGSWIPDIKSIKAWVDRVYGFRPTDYYRNYDFKFIGRKGPIKNWCCPN
jgi:hypothetical protein